MAFRSRSNQSEFKTKIALESPVNLFVDRNLICQEVVTPHQQTISNISSAFTLFEVSMANVN